MNIKERLWAEWDLLKRPFVFGTIIFTAIMQWMHNSAHNWVYFLAAKYKVYGGADNTLVDLGFIGMEDAFSYDFSGVSDIALYFVASFAVASCGSILFTNYIIQDPNIRMFQILVRSCWVCSIGVILRVVSFLITILPAPAAHCAQVTFDPPKTVSDIFFWGKIGDGCSDLLFSGHQMYGLVATCAIHHYVIVGNKAYKSTTPRIQWWIQRSIIVIAWLAALTEGIAIIRQKRHYSIDIWTAFYAVPFLWMSLAYVFPRDVGYKESADRVQQKAGGELLNETTSTV
jgi:hypothetical protein